MSDEQNSALDGFERELEAAIQHLSNKHAKGMRVPFHGDFANVPPSVLKRLKWWGRELRNTMGAPPAQQPPQAAEGEEQRKGLASQLRGYAELYPGVEVEAGLHAAAAELERLAGEVERTEGLSELLVQLQTHMSKCTCACAYVAKTRLLLKAVTAGVA